MHWHVLIFTSLLVTQPVVAQTDRIDWVRRHSVAIAVDAPTVNGFAELEPLAGILAGVRVVHLAELSHGEGNGSEARARLIRFLHQRLGFSVVVWEAGFYECHEMNELMVRNEPTHLVAGACLWPFWVDNRAIRSLLEYAQITSHTSNPLLMAGFDLQFTGRSLERRFEDLNRWFMEAGRALPPELARIVENPRGSRDTLIANARAFLSHFQHNAAVMRQVHGEDEARRIERVLLNVLEYQIMLQDRDSSRVDGPGARAAFVRSYNRRERVNADNLLWLVNEYYRDRKLIVWSHNVHAANTRFAADFTSLTPTDTGGSLESSGRRLKHELGDAVYTIGTTTFEGEWGFPDQPSERIRQAEPHSFESVLHRLDAPVLLVDLRPARRPDHWLRQPMPGSLSAQVSVAPYPVVWPATFDGVLFIQRMTAAGSAQ